MKILLIDDHALFRHGLKLLLEKLPGSHRFLEAESCEVALQAIADHHDIGLVLLDLTLPGMNGLDGVTQLKQLLPSAIPIVLLTASENPQFVMDGMRRGAQGFIPKSVSSDVMLAILQVVLAGGTYVPASGLRIAPEARLEQPLTARQQEVLQLMTAGKSNKEIADALNMRVNTVRVHVAAILKALCVSNRMQAATVALSLGLVQVNVA